MMMTMRQRNPCIQMAPLYRLRKEKHYVYTIIPLTTLKKDFVFVLDY
jgi:hypothetical protein